VPRIRNDAHRLIEECMVTANVQAAGFLQKNRLPTLFRVHAGPEQDRFEDLRTLMRALEIKVTDQARTDPKHLNKVLQQLKARPDYAVLAVAVLRSLSQALYQPANVGHFGLGLSAYAHFTSPIRRYPDLLVHRGIGFLLDGGKPGAFEYDPLSMDRLGKSCSMLERRAEDATRQVEARFKCAYMLDHIGDVLPGVVTGVTHFGLFVTLDDLFIEGLVHVTSLGNDYYHSEHGGLRLTGERTGTSYGLGDAVSVRVLRVNVDEAKLDFALADVSPTPRRRRN
jgi:ribonuclease R